MSGEQIRFNKPAIVGRELDYIEHAVEAGHTSCSGPFSRQASELLAEAVGAADVLLTTSCTAALEMAAMMLELGPDDTVVVPSFTMSSTAIAFARERAKLLFCDIDPITLGLDPAHLATLIDDSVRAVVPVHYAGVGCDMNGIERVIDGRDIAVVEDNAHGLFGRYQGRPLGGLGRFATLSFHETKNFICGEGGALIVNDEVDIDRAHVLYDKGTNRRNFMLGQVDKYSWQDIGSSFGMSEVLAAFLFAQLEQRDVVLAKRRRVSERYRHMLEPITDEFALTLPSVPADRDEAFHMFYVLLPDRQTRDFVLQSMQAQSVHPTFHYVPLHSAPGAAQFAKRATECPVTDNISGRLLRLPFHNDLAFEQAERVVELFTKALVDARGEVAPSQHHSDALPVDEMKTAS